MPRTSIKRPKAHASVAGYRLDDQIGFVLRRAYQRASANLIDRIGAYGLTVPQFATLARLHERGRVSQNLLGRLVVMEPANIRDVVQRLSKRGLVKTERAANDGRLVLIGLSRSGRALIENLIPVEVECTAKTLAPLDPGERRVLYELLGRLAQGHKAQAIAAQDNKTAKDNLAMAKRRLGEEFDRLIEPKTPQK